MTDYLNITEVESGLSGLASTYPALTELITLPNTTHEGRTTHALRIGIGSVSSKDGVLFIGGVHAREWGSCEICLNFAADLLEAYTLGTGLIYGGKSYTSSQVKKHRRRFTCLCLSPSQPRWPTFQPER